MNNNVIHERHRSSVWFTPLKIRSLAQHILGPHGISLDPCTHLSNPLQAHAIYTRADNALKRDWAAAIRSVSLESHATLYMNHPFGTGTAWTDKFLETVLAMRQLRGLSLIPARVGSRWYRDYTGASQCFCELDGRLRFEVLKGKRLVPAKDCARWGCVLVYFGPNRARAAAMMSPFGAVRMVNPSPALPSGASSDDVQLTIEQRIPCNVCDGTKAKHGPNCTTLEAHEQRDREDRDRRACLKPDPALRLVKP